MKYLIITLIAALTTQAFPFETSAIKNLVEETHIKRNRNNFKYPMNEMALMDYEYYRKLKTNKGIQTKLATIKYHIINGNLQKAKLMLLQSKYTEDFSKVIQMRYLAIIHFIQGEYEQSLSYLTKKEMYNIEFTKNICLLRTLNYIILNKTSEGKIEWNRCVDATLTHSPSSHLWMSTLLKLKLNNDEQNITDIPLKKINIENESGNFLRLFLKMALYLNKQDKVLERLQYINTEVYKDPEIRELIGLLYYRKGKILNSYRFIEDLTTPNAENIKGNIFLTQKKYELAYGQYKLALNKKIDSQNSLERIIPVAWLLNQWEDGLEYISKLTVDPKDKFTKMTVQAAFLTQKEDFKKAEKILNQVVTGSRNSQSPEVNQLFAYNAMMLNDLQTTSKFADQSCKNLDGINCWLQFQLNTWEHFPLTTKRDDPIFSNDKNLLEEYTENIKEDELKEKLYVNQEDIEELDNSIIRLIPKYE